MPETGLAFFFEHRQRHKGEQIMRGRKYVLRSDVMYRLESESEGGNDAQQGVEPTRAIRLPALPVWSSDRKGCSPVALGVIETAATERTLPVHFGQSRVSSRLRTLDQLGG